MPRMPEGYLEKRRDEILDACGELYERSSFHDVTIKAIAEYTSLSRPSIYNYFDTIEEIFLGLLQREYACWTEDLRKILDEKNMTREKLAEAVAHTLEPRRTLLRIQATNLHEIEDHCRLERLTEFKRAFNESMKAVEALLIEFVPAMDTEDRKYFLYTFFPFLYGVFPYSEPTEKQLQAMDAAEISHPGTSVYELVYHCLLKLLA